MRNNTIDLFRLLASFFVILLHVGLYSEYPDYIGESIRLSARWAVPFFFTVSGVFIALKNREKECVNTCLKILKIYIISSLIFIPYYLIKIKTGKSYFSIKQLIFSGTYFHLWFLSSLIIGLLIFSYLYSRISHKFLLAVSIAQLILFTASDILTCYGMNHTFFSYVRHLSSFSFISIGYLVVKSNIYKKINKNKTLIIYIILSLALSILIPNLISQLFYNNVMQRQFPVATPFLSTFLIIICLNNNISLNIFSRFGEKHSLGIYILHPIFLPITSKLLNYAVIKSDLIQAITTFAFTLILCIIIENRTPSLHRLINGNYIINNIIMNRFTRIR